jgi:hypothetical protein
MSTLILRKFTISLLVLCLGCTPLPASGERALIRIGINMPMAEVERGSTFPFAETRQEKSIYGGCVTENWMIVAPYDLEYVDGDHVLRIENLGGRSSLISVIADTELANQSCAVSRFQFSMQTSQLSIDEVMERIATLRKWMTSAGYRPPTEQEVANGNFHEPFLVGQIYQAPKLPFQIQNMADVRRAFIDKNAKVEKIGLQAWVSETSAIQIRIENVRRRQDYIAGVSANEDNVDTEKAYYLYISVTTRESQTEKFIILN